MLTFLFFSISQFVGIPRRATAAAQESQAFPADES
jgi:hypothetical protein